MQEQSPRAIRPDEYREELRKVRSMAMGRIPVMDDYGLDCWSVYRSYMSSEDSSGPATRDISTLVAIISGGYTIRKPIYGNCGYMLRVMTCEPFPTPFGIENLVSSMTVSSIGTTDYRVSTVLGGNGQTPLEVNPTGIPSQDIIKSYDMISAGVDSILPWFRVNGDSLSIGRSGLADIGPKPEVRELVGDTEQTVKPFGSSRSTRDGLFVLHEIVDILGKLEGLPPDYSGVLDF